jgi:hypothetical protein
MRGKRRHRLQVFAAGCCVLAAGGLGGCSVRSISSHEVFGAATSSPLTVDAAASSPGVKVSRSAAKHSVEHPFAAPELASGLKEFGLAHVTVGTGLATEGTAPIPGFDHRLAWVGIYEISKSGDHSCPAQPAPLPADLPPVFAHYYFAVVVDAATGQQFTWNEDMSGLLERQCAGTPTH